MAGGEWCPHGVERMGQGGRDPVPVQVLSARLDVIVVGLEPLVVGGSDPVAEDVDRLGLALEAHGQFLGDEGVVQVRDRLRARDRVVVGDGDEVHPLALGQFVNLFGRRGALR